MESKTYGTKLQKKCTKLQDNRNVFNEGLRENTDLWRPMRAMNTKNLMAILAMCLAAISLQAQSSHPIKIGSSFLELVNHFGNPSRTNGGNWAYWDSTPPSAADLRCRFQNDKLVLVQLEGPNQIPESGFWETLEAWTGINRTSWREVDNYNNGARVRYYYSLDGKMTARIDRGTMITITSMHWLRWLKGNYPDQDDPNWRFPIDL
jgi:hypothetical protein